MFNKVYEEVKNFIKENYKFLLFLVFIVAIFYIELPYKVYRPGGMAVLDNRIKVENGYETSGELGMAYVSVVKGSIPFLAASYLIPNWDIVPNEEVFDKNATWEETFKSDKIAMQQSIDNAIISAYHLANKEINITKEEAHVTYIASDAQTDILLFDILLDVEGKKISNLEDLRKIVKEHQIGDKIDLKVLRDDQELDVSASVYETEDGPKIGIGVTTTYEYDEVPKIEIKTKENESGPSGGLMMSLAIYNSLVEEDITHGKKIIGTGTIDKEGNVGEIGGVPYKLLGGEKKNCDIFLVPKDNLEEALKVKKENNLDIEVIGVSTLKEAISALNNV